MSLTSHQPPPLFQTFSWYREFILSLLLSMIPIFLISQGIHSFLFLFLLLLIIRIFFLLISGGSFLPHLFSLFYFLLLLRLHSFCTSILNSLSFFSFTEHKCGQWLMGFDSSTVKVQSPSALQVTPFSTSSFKVCFSDSLILP